jgi:hypothetical protein
MKSNHFGEVVSRRAGIIRLIDLALEDGPVEPLLAGKKEKLTEKGFLCWRIAAVVVRGQFREGRMSVVRCQMSENTGADKGGRGAGMV